MGLGYLCIYCIFFFFFGIFYIIRLGLVVKNQPANAGDVRDTRGRSPGGGHGNPLQYSCLENPMDRGAWQAIVHRVTQTWTRLK